MKNHPVDILFQTESNGFDNLFHELFSSKHAPVSIFKKDRDTNFGVQLFIALQF